MKYILLILLVICLSRVEGKAADTLRYRPLVVSVFSNATAMPGSTFIYSRAIHPGVCLGTEFKLNSSEVDRWYQSARVAGYYHQYSQFGLILLTENGFRHRFACGFTTGIAAGVGVLFSKADMDVFKLQPDGTYKQENFYRVQFTPSLAVRLGWDFMLASGLPLGVFVEHQAWFQMPYVKQYVPVVPNVATYLGVAIPLKKK